MPVKIASLELENVKRVRAVALEPAEDGLTVIGGRNGQGKTSVLDAIAWALGGGRMRPTEPKREGAAGDPRMRVELSNGIVVERKGAGSSLKVIDPEGRKSGQQLLDSLIDQLALDLPRFMQASPREKAETLLGIIGVGERLAELDRECESLYNQRHALGALARQKRHAAEEMKLYLDAPSEPVSASELIERQQAILARNGENARKRERAAAIEREHADASRAVADLESRLAEARQREEALASDLEVARKGAEQLRDESTEAIERDIAEIDRINHMVRMNAARASAMAEADELKAQYDDLTDQLEAARARRRGLLDGAELPLEGLSVESGELTYRGRRWDGMSGSEQLRVAAAIARAVKPECGFVLVDKLEQMDAETLAEFGRWAEGEGLQVIGTRVSTGDECSIVIEDGIGSAPAGAAPERQAWTI